MKELLKVLQQVNWPQLINTVIKVFSDLKNISLLVLLIFIIYGIGWDTVLRPSLQDLKKRDDAIHQQREVLNEKRNLQRQYETWANQLKGMNHDMIPVAAGDSVKVISVSESGEVLKIVKGELRETLGLAPLQPPHDHLIGISLTPASNTVTDLLPLLDPSSAAAVASPSASEANVPTPEATKLPVEQYDYELKVKGTYAALADLINQLVLYPKQVKLNKISIQKFSEEDAEELPDAKEFPDYPVQLEMTVSLSLLLYSAANDKQ